MAANRKIYYAHVPMSPQQSERMHDDYGSVISGKDETNIETALEIFQNLQDGIELFTSAQPLLELDASKSSYFITNSFSVQLFLNPSRVDCKSDPFLGQTCFTLFKFAQHNLLPSDIIHCFPNSTLAMIFSRLFNSHNFIELENNIDYAFGRINSICPARTPTTVIEQLLQITYKFGDYICAKSGDEFGETSNPTTSESIAERINSLSVHLNLINDAMFTHLATKPIPEKRKQTFIQFMSNLRKIEDIIQTKLNQFPETQRIKFKTLQFSVPLLELSFNHSPPLPPFPSQKVQITNTARGEIIENEVDISEFPRSHRVPLTNTDYLILGDLHANVITLLWFLIHENVVRGISARQYHALVKIHEAYHQQIITQDQRQFFIYVIGKLQAANPVSPNIIFLGDIIADRIGSDDPILIILKRMRDLSIPYMTFDSNHDREFIELYEKDAIQPETRPWLNTIYPEKTMSPVFMWQYASLFNLGQQIQKGLIQEEEIVKAFEEAYMPAFRAHACSINEEKKEFIYLSHTPSGLLTVGDIAKELNLKVEFDPANFKSIAATIDANNACVAELLRKKQFTATVKGKPALTRLAYHRVKDEEERDFDVVPKGWTIIYIHGHDQHGLIENLGPNKIDINKDTLLGKVPGQYKGSYSIYYMGNNPAFIKQREEAFAKNPKLSGSLRNFSLFAAKAGPVAADNPTLKRMDPSPSS